MKRFLVIPMMFIYLLAVSGIMVTAHYCGQEMESWSLFADSSKCVDGDCDDEPEQNDGCCKDKTVTAKVTNDQDAVSGFKLKTQTASDAILSSGIHFASQNDNSIAAAEVIAYKANAPPGLWQEIPLYKLLSSFTYYG